MNKPLETLTTEAALRLADDERQPCEIWTRVMGYHRPVASFNLGKKGEHKERKHFKENAPHLPLFTTESACCSGH